MQYNVKITKDVDTPEPLSHTELISASNPRTAVAKALRLLNKQYRYKLGRWQGAAGQITIEYQKV